ncbi:paraquat-inducible protein A [Marinobacterium halophilum]|uniref:Paraquat-inducible protein A n=1 Tax=Marinobacterium halophilum TaxID=267374 RepID=A0A2P8EZU1_9GAMM|nr:paraquat-inducible protein A [Marinobacterium halophilum]PSL14975.1 paraquat-inducible protein A [Marinobacterium halophilum]
MSRVKCFISEEIIWVVACVLFIAGISLPMFTFHKLIVFSDEFSLISAVVHLFREGEIFIFLILFIFSIAIPAVKLYLIVRLIKNKEPDKEKKALMVKRLAIIGKWSMADVFVISIIVSTIKLGVIASVSVHVGIIFFGLSVLLSMLLVQKQMAGYEFRAKAGAR